MVIGLDGFDAALAERFMLSGDLPNLASLRDWGGYARLRTTLPAQTPVAWSTFAVGANPGTHGIFDFLGRDAQEYLPEIGLFRHEQRSRFLPPKAVNLRDGRPVWDRISRAGLPSTILRHPCTYPPDSFKGRLLAGVGVPDLRGGFGSSSFYTTEDGVTSGESEHAFQVHVDGDGSGRFELLGPWGPNREELHLALDLEVDGTRNQVRISCPDGSFSHLLPQGQWTGWVSVRFRLGRVQSVRGLVRFHLRSTDPLRLFSSPIQYDPDSPLFPISHPWDYAGELKRVIGPFATLGLAEEHNGLTNGRIDEAAFLSHSVDIMHERRAMMHYELARFEEGLFYCLFDTPDRVQHMFWRFTEPDHPANLGEPPAREWVGVIKDYYRRCDEIVGEAVSYCDPETLLMVVSDHGFASFQRKIHLNTWLHREGYLALKPGVEPGSSAGDFLRFVDWDRTRAYAVGLSGLYLNLRGREGQGIVDPADAPGLRQEISGRLRGLVDPERGAVAVREAFSRESVYSGPRTQDAPDVLLACSPGFRVSSATAMGGLGDKLFTDNTRQWSGDHAVDPVSVPGVLFMDAPFRDENPHLLDLAPTILKALGVPEDGDLEGRSLI